MKSCENCRYRKIDEDCLPCSACIDLGSDLSGWVGLTNADSIRGMTDVELATNFASRCCPAKDEFYNCGEINKKEFSWEDCKDCWIDWLKSPVDEVVT